MKLTTLFASALVASIALPLSAQAQGVPGGFVHGVNEGYRIAGPVGAVVGGPVGGIIGGVEGMLGVDYHYREAPRVYHRRVAYRHAKQTRRHVRRARVVR